MQTSCLWGKNVFLFQKEHNANQCNVVSWRYLLHSSMQQTKKKQQKETNQSVFTLFPKSCSGTIVLYVDLVVTTQTPRKQDHIQREVSHTSDHTNISICHSFSFFHVFLLLNQQSTINYMHYSTVFQAALIKLH